MKKYLLLVALSPLLLTGCAGMLVGAGATAGVAAAQEGGVKRAWSDAQIQAQINKLWFEYDVDTFAKLDLTINQGRVHIVEPDLDAYVRSAVSAGKLKAFKIGKEFRIKRDEYEKFLNSVKTQ